MYNPERIKEIEAFYGPGSGHYYWTLLCSLCGYVVNGHSPDEAKTLLDEHQATHPEWLEYQAALPKKEDVSGLLGVGELSQLEMGL